MTGSSQLITEFLAYAINAILYQRGIYPPSAFAPHNKYGITVHVTTDAQLIAYIQSILSQVSAWIKDGRVKRLVLVVTDSATNETIERWVFAIDCSNAVVSANTATTATSADANIPKQIAAIIRQITSSVSFLPLLEVPCSFDLIVHTPTNVSTPAQWEETDPRLIRTANAVKLRSLNTRQHQLHTTVAYKADELTV